MDVATAEDGALGRAVVEFVKADPSRFDLVVCGSRVMGALKRCGGSCSEGSTGLLPFVD